LSTGDVRTGPEKTKRKTRNSVKNLAKTKSEGGAQLKAQRTALCEFPYASRLRNPVSKTGGFSAQSLVSSDPFPACAASPKHSQKATKHVNSHL